MSPYYFTESAIPPGYTERDQLTIGELFKLKAHDGLR